VRVRGRKASRVHTHASREDNLAGHVGLCAERLAAVDWSILRHVSCADRLGPITSTNLDCECGAFPRYGCRSSLEGRHLALTTALHRGKEAGLYSDFRCNIGLESLLSDDAREHFGGLYKVDFGTSSFQFTDAFQMWSVQTIVRSAPWASFRVG